MYCIWQHGPLFVREIVELMPQPKPHFNTVATFVRSLEAKGWLRHEQFGNAFRYAPAVDMEQYRDRSIKGIVGRLFNNSYLSFVTTLVKQEKISTEELRELIEKIENQQED